MYFSDEVKAHRRETANEGADILADKAISDPKVGKKWCQQTNRAVYTWGKPCREAGKVILQDRHSTFNNSVRDAIRRGAAENEVQKHVYIIHMYSLFISLSLCLYTYIKKRRIGA